MPELPEVETIKRGAKEKIVGKTIKDIEVRAKKLFLGNPKEIIGAKIVDIKRVAKVLRIILSNQKEILIHLKMTGQLVFEAEGKEVACAVGGHMQKAYGQPLPHKHTHIIYWFSDGSKLFFNDLRKFGWNRILSKSEAEKFLSREHFGPEPLSKDFTLDYLKTIFLKTSKKIKEVLTDQSKIAGLGNIYANDALYWAGVLPSRKAKSLSDGEVSKLKSAIEKVIEMGLKYGGSSENTYVNIEGKRGRYMDYAALYQQKTDPKGHPVQRQKIAGRGTFYCDICQK